MNTSPETLKLCGIIAAIVVVAVAAIWVWAARDPNRPTPDAVRAVRNRPRPVESERSTPPARPVLFETPDVTLRHRSVEPVDEPDGGDAPVDADPEPVDVDEPETPRYARDIFGRDGATEEWAQILHDAAAGQLLPAGVPEVSRDEVSDWDLWEAQWDEEWRQLDDRLEAIVRRCTAGMIAAGTPLECMQAVLRADIIAHEEAVAVATSATTGEIRLSLPPVGETPAQRKRRVKHEHRQRGLVGAAA